MKILIICNTWYQLIAAIQIRKTLLSADCVDLIVSDQSNGAEDVSKNIKNERIFNNVYYIKNKELIAATHSIMSKIDRCRYIISGYDVLEIKDIKYDAMFYFNPDVFAYGLFAKLADLNPSLICNRFEEGILSYSDYSYLNKGFLSLVNHCRNFWGKLCLEKATSAFYCFYPEFYKGNIPAVAIPKIPIDGRFGGILQRVFNVNPNDLIIKQKYIFFTSVYDFEGGEPIGETELVQKIAKIVGKENLIVKIHPRDVRDAFKRSGIRVYEHSEIPWEAIQLNNDFSTKVLLTVNSGSVIGANMMIENKAPALFLYKCCNYKINTAAVGTSQMIDRFVSELKDVNVKSIESLEEFRTIIGKLN